MFFVPTELINIHMYQISRFCYLYTPTNDFRGNVTVFATSTEIDQSLMKYSDWMLESD